MARHGFKAVVLDLFNTLVKWEPGRLPTYQWQGREISSTVPILLPRLRELLPNWNHDQAYIENYHAVVIEIAAERERDEIEITCHERFLRTLQRLALPVEFSLSDLAERLTRTHMAAVRGVTSAPAPNVAAVHRLARHYRLGLLSNFDDSKTGREIVDDTGVGHLFEAVVISADVALRKPNPLIFSHMLAMLSLEPDEVLFVGDTPHEDVVGAKRAGIPVAWLSHGRSEIPDGIEQPDLIVETLADLPQALGL